MNDIQEGYTVDVEVKVEVHMEHDSGIGWWYTVDVEAKVEVYMEHDSSIGWGDIFRKVNNFTPWENLETER